MSFFAPDLLWRWVVALTVALVCATFLYRKPQPFSAKFTTLLFLLRTGWLAGLVFLLLSPRFYKSRFLNTMPEIAVGVDNSLSMQHAYGDSTQSVQKLREICLNIDKWAEEKRVRIHWHTLDKEGVQPENLQFNHVETPLSAMLSRMQNLHQQKNLSHALLLSDGLFNRGGHPVYVRPFVPIHALAVGDPQPKKDLAITDARYKKKVYAGNDVAIDLTLNQHGLLSKKTRLLVYENQTLIATVPVILSGKTFQLRHLLSPPKPEKGGSEKHLYTFVLEPITGEWTEKNNSLSLYVEVISQKTRVFLLSPVPHADVKALFSALKQQRSYEIICHILSLARETPDLKNMDVALAYQAFGSSPPQMQTMLQRLRDKAVPIWYFLTPKADAQVLRELSPTLGGLKLQSPVQISVNPQYEPAFDLFQVSPELASRLGSSSQVQVPDLAFLYAQQNLQTLFRQRIGQIGTTQPLWLVGKQVSTRLALTLGVGWWRIRMQEYQQHGSHQAFDQLVTKTVQYLSIRRDKRRFNLTPTQDFFLDTQPPTFRVQCLNDLYEPIQGQEVLFKLWEKKQVKHAQTFYTRHKQLLTLPHLPKGKYNFLAKTKLSGEDKIIKGHLLVQENNWELVSLQSDHKLMKNLSKRHRGQFLDLHAQPNVLTPFLQTLELPSGTETKKVSFWLVEERAYLVILLLLALSEWFLRKYLHGDV